MWISPQRIAIGLGIAALAFVPCDCSNQVLIERGGVKAVSEKTIGEVLKAHTDEWMAVPGVVGVGIGETNGRPCIRIFVTQKTEALAEKIPDRVEGFPVRIDEAGEFRARGQEK